MGEDFPKPNNSAENREEKKKRILVVDDDSSMRESSVAALEFFGYEVVAAKSGEELLARINSGETFDAIISDNNMFKIDGIDALEQIHQNPKFNNVRLILRSGMGNSELKERVSKIGGLYLDKPHGIDALKEILEKAFKGMIN